MSDKAIWLKEDDVTSLVTLDETIAALEKSLASLNAGTAFNVPKALGGFDDGSSMHSLGSGMPDAGFVGYKSWVHTKRGAKAVYTLFDSHEGRILALMEAASLGQLRTSAMTGVGTKWMAPAGVADMAMIGTGSQALAQVASVNAVRPLKHIRVWSPTADKREAFAARLRERFDAEVMVAASLEAALEGAPLVTMVTRAKEPFLKGSMLAAGTHFNAVGAILPANAEFFPDVFDRVDFIAVDDVVGAQKASKEFIDYFEKGGRGWDRVLPLGKVIADGLKRPSTSGISLFKSMGMGISDLSVAMLAYQRAKDKGIGAGFDVSDKPSPVRWNSSKT